MSQANAKYKVVLPETEWTIKLGSWVFGGGVSATQPALSQITPYKYLKYVPQYDTPWVNMYVTVTNPYADDFVVDKDGYITDMKFTIPIKIRIVNVSDTTAQVTYNTDVSTIYKQYISNNSNDPSHSPLNASNETVKTFYRTQLDKQAFYYQPYPDVDPVQVKWKGFKNFSPPKLLEFVLQRLDFMNFKNSPLT